MAGSLNKRDLRNEIGNGKKETFSSALKMRSRKIGDGERRRTYVMIHGR